MSSSRSIPRMLFWAAMAVPALVSPVFSQKSAEWKGRLEKEGEVVVVKNPNKPVFETGAFSLEEDLAIGGAEGADYLFASIDSIAVSPDGTIFVLDAKDKLIKVFDRDGKFLRTFGKSGEGPGEFTLPLSLHWTAGGEIMVADARRKLSFFKPGGEFVRDLSTPTLDLGEARPDSRDNLFVYLISREAATPGYVLRKVDSGLKGLFTIESSPLPDFARDGFNPFFPVLRWAVLPDDGVVCGYAVTYELRIYSREGKLARKIQMNPDPVSIAKEDLDERTEGVPPTLKQNMKIPKHYPAFRYIISDDTGRIYVLAWERPPGRKGFYFDVFDPDGKYVARAVLPVLQPFIRNGRLYAAEENADGDPVLKRFRITWKS